MIASKFQCPACQDKYPILSFIRDVDEDDFATFDEDDWAGAHISIITDKFGQPTKVLNLGGEVFDLSPFCSECGQMIAIARKKMDERLGSGSVKTKRKDGKYVDLESHQEYMYLVGETEPEIEFAYEGELDNRGEPLSFTDVDLARLSYWRIAKVLRDKGFNEVPWHEIEDHAQNVSLLFIEKLKCAGCETLCYINGDPCDVGAPKESIDSLHAYHWACCKGEAKRLMQEWVNRRMQEIPEDVLDVAKAMNMTDGAIVGAWRNGAVEFIDRHEVQSPLWTRLDIGDLCLEFGAKGIDLSSREVKVLRNAVLSHAGVSRDGKNTDKVRTIMNKLGDKAPEAYAVLKGRIGTLE